MKFNSLLEEVIAGILIGFCTYFFLMPFLHEMGHAFFASWCNWEIIEIHISIPALVTPSYVIISAPVGANLTFFYAWGSWSCLFWGFLISLIPIFMKNYFIFLSIGYGLMSDAIVYPIYSNIAGYGDWVKVDFILNLFTVLLAILLILLSVLINRITKWRLK